jgi:hypothetical protein
MSHLFYALYELKTLTPISVSGQPFDQIPEGYSVCTLGQSDAEGVFSHQLRMHDHFLRIKNGHGVLKNKLDTLLSRRDGLSNRIVRDLDYRIMFFDYLNISVDLNNHSLILGLDLDSLDDTVQQKFTDLITEQNNMATFYVTAYQDMAKLLCKFDIDLYQFSKDKTYQTTINFDHDISIWARQ